MSKFTEYIGSQFGNPRGVVGFICCKLMNIINNKMYKKTAQLMEHGENKKILDIGYGNGHLLKVLDKKSPMLYGIDISPDMQKLALKSNRRANREGRIQLLVGDCASLPFENSFFDSISSINTVYFWSDVLTGLKEIKRCLCDGGNFYNVVYTRDWLNKLSYTKTGFKKYGSAELVQFGKEAGFSKVDVQEIVPGKSFVVIYKK